jgi:hypothetical protein
MVQGTLRHSDPSTSADLYGHLEDQVLHALAQILTAEIVANGDLFAEKESQMVR